MNILYDIPKKHHELLIIILFIILIIVISFIETYDSLELISYYEDNSYKIIIPISEKDKLKESYILYKENKYKIYDVKYSEPIYDNDNYFYEVEFKSDLILEENIVSIKIINNKQRILKKIKNIIWEE